MQRASVTRLFKDRSTHEAIMLLEGNDTKERFRVTIPASRAGILAMEGHGLNDRCPLYRILSECIDALDALFGSVVITLDDANGVQGAVAISRNGEIISWINGDVIELVAFALHVQLPIYIHHEGPVGANKSPARSGEITLPAVFEDALSDILKSDAGAHEGDND